MTAIMSDRTKEQATVLAEFTRLREVLRGSIVELAGAYRKCVDAGCDLRNVISAGEALRLDAIASGRLLTKPGIVLEAVPLKLISALSSLAKSEQEKLWDDGAVIWRDGEAKTVPLAHLTASEARRFIDIMNGKGRVLTPDEQRERITPSVQKRDHKVEVRLTYEEALAARALAHKKGKPLELLIRELLRRETE